MRRDEPGEAYLETRDGERVLCLLERTGPNEWQAVPVRDVERDEVVATYIDVLPGKSRVFFVLVDP